MVCRECFFTVIDHAGSSECTDPEARIHTCRKCDDWSLEEILGNSLKDEIPRVVKYIHHMNALKRKALLDELQNTNIFVDNTEKSMEDRVVTARAAISEIMCDACPSCKSVHLEFDACMSVSCRTCKDINGRPLNFCAWCYEFVGTSQEVHDHLHICPQHLPRIPGQLSFTFCSAELINIASHVAQMKKITILMAKMQPEVGLLLFYKKS